MTKRQALKYESELSQNVPKPYAHYVKKVKQLTWITDNYDELIIKRK